MLGNIAIIRRVLLGLNLLLTIEFFIIANMYTAKLGRRDYAVGLCTLTGYQYYILV